MNAGYRSIHLIVGSCLLLGAATAMSTAHSQPAHTSNYLGNAIYSSPLNVFIDPAMLMPSTCAATDATTDCTQKLSDETIAYYKAIGVYDAIKIDPTTNKKIGIPSASRGTFNQWKATLGFSADPTALGAGGLGRSTSMTLTCNLHAICIAARLRIRLRQ